MSAPAVWGFCCLMLFESCAGPGVTPAIQTQPSTGTTYATDFPRTENPISESGKWINGKALGLDWSDVAAISGLAYGTQSGVAPGLQKFDDSTALLSGTWGSDQSAEGTVHSVNQNDAIYQEVELRLRSILSAHTNTGYEINFRCSKTQSAYAEIVRWNGSLGDYTYLLQKKGSQYGVATGDVVKATVKGNTITVYINGVQVAEVRDNAYTTGNPGIGFYLHGSTGVNKNCGFSRFKAADNV